jgi:E3 ubiquitin-protein ligase MUL1
MKYMDKDYEKVHRTVVDSAESILGREKIVPSELSERNDEKSQESDTDRFICQICMVNRRNTIFLPCNHILSCNLCAIKMDSKKCPYCNTDVQAVNNVRFP